MHTCIFFCMPQNEFVQLWQFFTFCVNEHGDMKSTSAGLGEEETAAEVCVEVLSSITDKEPDGSPQTSGG